MQVVVSTRHGGLSDRQEERVRRQLRRQRDRHTAHQGPGAGSVPSEEGEPA